MDLTRAPCVIMGIEGLSMTPHPRAPRTMPPLLRLFALHGAFGATIGLLTVAFLVLSDVSGLWTLAAGASGGWIGIALLAVGLCVTFGGAAIATAIMLLPEDPGDDPPQGGSRGPAPRLAPVRVRSRNHRT
jgi:hypothetical protein